MSVLPDVFENLDRYNSNAKAFWKHHFEKYGDFYETECHSDWYGSTFLSRPYIDLVDKSKSDLYFSEIKKLWQNRDLLIVEGKRLNQVWAMTFLKMHILSNES